MELSYGNLLTVVMIPGEVEVLSAGPGFLVYFSLYIMGYFLIQDIYELKIIRTYIV